jgi:hypothetical protein
MLTLSRKGHFSRSFTFSAKTPYIQFRMNFHISKLSLLASVASTSSLTGRNLAPNNSFKPTPCRGVGHVLYATLAHVRRPAKGRLNSGVSCQWKTSPRIHLKSVSSICRVTDSQMRLSSLSLRRTGAQAVMQLRASNSAARIQHHSLQPFPRRWIALQAQQYHGRPTTQTSAACLATSRYASPTLFMSLQCRHTATFHYMFTRTCLAANNSFKPTPHRGVGHVPALR